MKYADPHSSYRMKCLFRSARTSSTGCYGQLGVLALLRGDYDAALDWCRKSLAISEQLGDRNAMALAYHQLGIVAEERDDDDAALDWYNKSLAIMEQLGDRAGVARATGQIGSLYTKRERAADAVPLTLRSLALCLEIGSPEVWTNLYWLSRQRSMLGVDAFRALAAQHVDAEGMTNLLAMLDRYDAE